MHPTSLSGNSSPSWERFGIIIMTTIFFIAVAAITGALSVYMKNTLPHPFIVLRIVTAYGIGVGILASTLLYWVFTRDLEHQMGSAYRKSVSTKWVDDM